MIGAFIVVATCQDPDACPFPVDAVLTAALAALVMFLVLSVLVAVAEKRGYRPPARRRHRKYGPGWGYNPRRRRRR